MTHKLSKILLDWAHTYRVIPSKFPPINFFENLVDPSLMDELYYIESLTNDRLRQEAGDISLVASEDRVSGESASIVMAPFTHISTDRPSRFTNGTFGIYYAAKSYQTALKERAYHAERFLAATAESACQITVRVYQSKKIIKPLIDVRGFKFNDLHHPTDYRASQAFGFAQKSANEWGIVYRSLRHSNSECVAILRPCAVPLPVIQTKHFNYVWNGEKILNAYEISGEILEMG